MRTVTDLQVREYLRKRILEYGGFEAVACALGCTPSALYNHVNNEQRRPSQDLAAALETLLGVPASAWVRPFEPWATPPAVAPRRRAKR